MVLLVTLIFIQYGVGLVGSMPAPGSPENITVMFLSPTSVRISWRTAIEHIEKYDVMYKPTEASYRVVAVVAGNSDSVVLSGLLPDTQYQVTVTAVRAGKKFRSRPIVFRTLELPLGEGGVHMTGGQPGVVVGSSRSGIPPLPNSLPPTHIQVRGVEVGIVLLVLLVWVGAIALFFNRWGKIRMLLPYQPDYKETQLKVPGSGTCNASNTCQAQGPSAFCCSQRHLHRWAAEESFDWRTRSAFIMPSRSRINSAIYVSAQCRSSEHEPLFHSEHCPALRRAKSADNLRTALSPETDFKQLVRTKPLELPILSISIASVAEAEKLFVEEYL